MSGGRAFTSQETREIGDRIGVDWNLIPLQESRVGLHVELDHGLPDPRTDVTGGDPLLTGKIAWAHLNEFPDYYTRPTRMEAEAEGKL